MAPRPADLLAKTGPIAAVAASTLAVVALGLKEAGVKVVGEIPQSLPPFTVPLFDAELWGRLAIPALLLSVIGFVESVSVADRKSVVSGKSVSVRVDLGGRRSIKKKHNKQ